MERAFKIKSPKTASVWLTLTIIGIVLLLIGIFNSGLLAAIVLIPVIIVLGFVAFILSILLMILLAVIIFAPRIKNFAQGLKNISDSKINRDIL